MSNQSDTKVTYLQKYAYNVLNSGYNVFMTGGAGTGKSFILRKFIEKSTEQGLNVMVTAPTGVAALNIGGITIHRSFNTPLGPLTYTRCNVEVSDELVNTDIVVIDEISMCRIDLFEFIANKILTANQKRRNLLKPSIQLVVSGDFFQLPPVITKFDKSAIERYYGTSVRSGFAFQSKFWRLFDFKYIILTEVLRQTDIEFMSKLNELRCGNIGTLEYFYKNSNPNLIENGITLCGTRSEADSKNASELAKLPGETHEYMAIIEGDIESSEYTSENILELKIGARVMITMNESKNDSNIGTNYTYINGSLGHIVGLGENEINVELDTGETVSISRDTETVYQYTLQESENNSNKLMLVKEEIGSVEQFPLRLAYAITIHKSQGQTYENVNLSPYSWDCGQLYVAISRMRSLNGLHFNYEPNIKDVKVSSDVIAFHNEIVKEANKNVDIHERKTEIKIENRDASSLLDMLSKL
jgi:ATP-dependent exoDNAse (exonuclease V) alpha subunit